MSVTERHEHGRTTFASEGVNGVYFCFIVQSLPRQLFLQLFFLRRSRSTPFFIACRPLDRLGSVHTLFQSPRVGIKNHMSMRESMESLSASSLSLSLLRQLCKSLRVMIMSAGGRYEHMSTPCVYDEVNGLISALASLSLLREFDI